VPAPALRVGDGEPAEEIGDLSFLAPSHNAVKDFGSRQHAFCRVGSAREASAGPPQPTVGAIQHMLRRAAHQRPGTSRHARIRSTSRCVDDGHDSGLL
jgi:hypothetical protein